MSLIIAATVHLPPELCAARESSIGKTVPSRRLPFTVTGLPRALPFPVLTNLSKPSLWRARYSSGMRSSMAILDASSC